MPLSYAVVQDDPAKFRLCIGLTQAAFGGLLATFALVWGRHRHTALEAILCFSARGPMTLADVFTTCPSLAFLIGGTERPAR